MIAKRISSLKEVAEISREQNTFSYALRDFLDAFYNDPTFEKLAEEPALLSTSLNDNGLADAYLAAVADHLRREYRLALPAWAKKTHRVLKTPYFAASTHGLRMIYLQESPSAFKERNIFVSANTLSRA